MNIYFGENLRELRQKRKLTQENLADCLNVSFQTISKWERGETYPDICTLPDIAGFFKISVDELLGVNRAEIEAEIVRGLEMYDNLTDIDLRKGSIYDLKKKFPNDFRVLLRYMSFLIHFTEKTSEVKIKIITIYENIRQNCNTDRIRISAKRHIIEFYRELAENDDSGITFEDCEKIINEMPKMRDGLELLSILYPENHPMREDKIRNALEEELLLFSNTLSHYYLFNDEFDYAFKIKMLEKEIDLLNFIYDDGNYGKMWQAVIYKYGYLGVYCHKNGDNEKALLSFKKCAELAIQFDSLDKITVLNSELFKGKEFNKDTLGSTYKAQNRFKMLLTETYPLSEDFKSLNEFKEILKALG
ncbi:MAG: helix-turn-helix domain-containing protein [Clostridia bacterium]|nr:helix-turn-helix domain-containing protein [Clostridia bacterium]